MPQQGRLGRALYVINLTLAVVPSTTSSQKENE